MSPMLLQPARHTPAASQATLVGTAENETGASGTSWTINLPAGIQVGDLLVISLASSFPATLSGWTLEASAGSSWNIGRVWSKIATSTEVTAGTVSISLTGSHQATAYTMAFRNHASMVIPRFSDQSTSSPATSTVPASVVTVPLAVSGSDTDAAAYAAGQTFTLYPDQAILCVVTTGQTTSAPDVTGITGTLGTQLTWQDLGDVLMFSSNRGRTTMWYAKNTGATTLTGTLTFDLAATAGNCQWTVFVLDGYDNNPLTGANTSPLYWRNSTANPSTAFGSTPDTDSLVVASLHSNETNAPAAGSGWTLATSGSSRSSPTVRCAVEYDSTSPSATVAFSLAGTFNRGLMAVEINAKARVVRPGSLVVYTTHVREPSGAGAGAFTVSRGTLQDSLYATSSPTRSASIYTESFPAGGSAVLPTYTRAGTATSGHFLTMLEIPAAA